MTKKVLKILNEFLKQTKVDYATANVVDTKREKVKAIIVELNNGITLSSQVRVDDADKMTEDLKHFVTECKQYEDIKGVK